MNDSRIQLPVLDNTNVLLSADIEVHSIHAQQQNSNNLPNVLVNEGYSMSAQKSFLQFRLKDGSEGVNVANFGCAAMHMHSRSAKIIPCCFISFLLQRKPSSSRGEKTGILAWEQIPLT